MKVVNGVLKKIGIHDLKDGKLILPEGVTEIACDALIEIKPYIKKIIFPTSMKKIENSRFMECPILEEIELKEGLEVIEICAFYRCKCLSAVKFPSTLKKIERAAFANTGITSIELKGGIKAVESSTFSRCYKLRKVILGEGITTIENEAFKGCVSLEEIILPNTLTAIKDRVFVECGNLENIILPESLESIGEYAFHYAGLKKIEIPEKVSKINSGTFSKCCSLNEVIFKGNVTEINHDAFIYTAIKNIDLPNSLIKVSSSVFRFCSELESAILPENLENIESYMYSGCSKLSKVLLPKKLKRIGDSAFKGCIGLSDITFPESLTEIDEKAFSNCDSLSKLDLPKNLEKIGQGAFSNCTNMEYVSMKDHIKTIENDAFYRTIIKRLVTPWGEYEQEFEFWFDIQMVYLYLFANHFLKEKYESIEDFLKNHDINETINGYENIISKERSIQKFKNIFSKLRKEYDVGSHLFGLLNEQTTEAFSYSVWQEIKNTVGSTFSVEMAEALSEMIEIFGLFYKDEKLNQRIKKFKSLFEESEYTFTKEKYQELLNDIKERGLLPDQDYQKSLYYYNEIEASFDRKEIGVFKIKKGIEIPKEFSMYLTETISQNQMKCMKKITGSYGKRLIDFIKENYRLERIEVYSINEFGKNNSNLRKKLFNWGIFGYVNSETMHQIFDGCDKSFNKDFYEFFVENLPFIIKNEIIQDDVKKIQKQFESMKMYYLRFAGSKKVTLNQALDYINNAHFNYHSGNYELANDIKNAGVTSQETFDYYQEIYENNQVRRKRSLMPRSNIYEVDGYVIKAELLRKDDALTFLVGERNYTNCCQRYQGVGHNCMAHATSSDDGGIFVTRLLKDGEWILLTQSWDWQNNNLYCHDNIEATPYLKNGPKELKKAVASTLKLDAEYMIEKSKEKVEEYIKKKRKSLEKSSSKNHQEELEKLSKLSKNQVIKVVTCGSGYDDLGLERYVHNKINISEKELKENKKIIHLVISNQ